MVHIYSISICKDISEITTRNDDKLKCIILASYSPPPSWSAYFYQNSITEFTTFISKFVTVRTPKGMKQQIDKDQLVAYIKKDVGSMGLASVVITDKEYPSRVAFDLTEVMLQNFLKFAQDKKLTGVVNVARNEGMFQKDFSPSLKDLHTKYQEPTERDKILKAKQSIDEINKLVHLKIDQVLKNGEQIDELIAKSPDLSNSAKSFYVQSKNSNCCTIL